MDTPVVLQKTTRQSLLRPLSSGASTEQLATNTCRDNFGRNNFGRDNFGRNNFGLQGVTAQHATNTCFHPLPNVIRREHEHTREHAPSHEHVAVPPSILRAHVLFLTFVSSPHPVIVHVSFLVQLTTARCEGVHRPTLLHSEV